MAVRPSMARPFFHTAPAFSQQRATARTDRAPALLPLLVVLLWAMAAGVSAEQVAAYAAQQRTTPQDHLVQRAITETRVARRLTLRDEHKPAEAPSTQQPSIAGLTSNQALALGQGHGQIRAWCSQAACGLLALPPPIG